MASRRSRRAHGRVQNTPTTRKATPSITKAHKQATRLQHKAAILAAARNVRQAVKTQPPLLFAIIPLTDTLPSRLDSLTAALRTAALTEKSVRPFDFVSVRRADGDTGKRATLLSALDAAKVADSLVLVFDGTKDPDDTAHTLLDALRAQGLPSVHVVATGDGAPNADLRKLRGRQLAAESLGVEHSLRPIPVDCDGGADADAINRSALRRLFAKPPREVSWRKRYGYMRVDAASVEPTSEDGKVGLSLCGWIRGRGFSANELVHLTGFGSFAAKEIVDVTSGKTLSVRSTVDGEPIESVAEVDETMGEQTWPPEMDGEMGNEADYEDEDEGEEDNDNDLGQALAKLYDEAAERDNAEDGEPEAERDNNEMVVMDEDDMTGEDGTTDHADYDDMTIDEDEVRRVREAAKNDSEFPDEVDTPVDQSARVRFARYRGLKSLRTGAWDPKEQLPREYASLFQFRNLPATRKRILAQARREAEAARCDENGGNFAVCGRQVYIRLIDVSADVATRVMQCLQNNESGIPVVASGMLRHENRRSVVHFAVRRIDQEENADVVKAKSHLEMHVGFVRFDGRPMFSEHNVNSDKHKMDRFLRHGAMTVVSFYGPAVFAPAPALLCHVGGGVIATGSALGADPDRIILKRILLTGYPFKTQKRRTVVKFMFFQPEDIRWFKPVELWTKLGRTGNIIEPVGTHGHMKCMFDSVVMHHDTICMTLYKRVYPKLVDEQSHEGTTSRAGTSVAVQ